MGGGGPPPIYPSQWPEGGGANPNLCLSLSTNLIPVPNKQSPNMSPGQLCFFLHFFKNLSLTPDFNLPLGGPFIEGFPSPAQYIAVSEVFGFNSSHLTWSVFYAAVSFECDYIFITSLNGIHYVFNLNSDSFIITFDSLHLF